MRFAEPVDLVENSTVETPYRSRFDSASSITARTSRTPAVTADSCTNRRPEDWAIAWAIAVFPCRAAPRGSPIPTLAPCQPRSAKLTRHR